MFVILFSVLLFNANNTASAGFVFDPVRSSPFGPPTKGIVQPLPCPDDPSRWCVTASVSYDRNSIPGLPAGPWKKILENFDTTQNPAILEEELVNVGIPWILWNETITTDGMEWGEILIEGKISGIPFSLTCPALQNVCSSMGVSIQRNLQNKQIGIIFIPLLAIGGSTLTFEKQLEYVGPPTSDLVDIEIIEHPTILSEEFWKIIDRDKSRGVKLEFTPLGVNEIKTLNHATVIFDDIQRTFFDPIATCQKFIFPIICEFFDLLIGALKKISVTQALNIWVALGATEAWAKANLGIGVKPDGSMEMWWTPTPIVSVGSDVDVLLIDNQGRRIGSIWNEGFFVEDVNEIPGAFYSGHGTLPSFIKLPQDVIVSSIEIIGLSSGTYHFVFAGFGEQGNFLREFDGTLGEMETQTFPVSEFLSSSIFYDSPPNIIGETVLIGGTLLPLDTTVLLLAGAQNIAAWLIPIIVSAIGIGIVIARKL